jgi:hypothetical protein
MGADSGQAKMPPEAEFSSRVKWKYADKAADFHRRHGYARYTMDFISTLETEMRDPELSKEHRALAAIKRYSWGNLSDFAVSGMPKIGPDDPEPRPLTQAELARGIGMSAATMSEACRVLRERFYVRSGVQDLYPEEQKAGTSFRSASQLSPSGSVNLAQESNSNSANGDSPFVRFRLAYLDAHPDVAREIGFHQAERDRHDEAAHKERDELRRMDREILGPFGMRNGSVRALRNSPQRLRQVPVVKMRQTVSTPQITRILFFELRRQMRHHRLLTPRTNRPRLPNKNFGLHKRRFRLHRRRNHLSHLISTTDQASP